MVRGLTQCLEQIERMGMDLSGRIAARAIGPEPPLAFLLQNRFRQYRPGGIAGAQEQRPIDPFVHAREAFDGAQQLPSDALAETADSSGASP